MLDVLPGTADYRRCWGQAEGEIFPTGCSGVFRMQWVTYVQVIIVLFILVFQPS